ncbi:MAG TPA: hypothetical protein VH637_06055 [Streptosporangiaceae bacterium]|jgi:hypothetical protein
MKTRYSRRGLGVAMLAGIGVAALAGCGSVTAGSTAASGPGSQASAGGSPSQGSQVPARTPAPDRSAASARAAARQAPLCAAAKSVTKLVVVRNRAVNRIQVEHFPFPGQVTVSDAAQARAVAVALCALPAMPPGIVNCPNLLVGTTYRLTFSIEGKPLPLVTVQSTGCQSVTGAGPVRRASAQGFWKVLGTAVGLRGAGPPVFSGTGPDGALCRTATFREVLTRGCPGMERPLTSPRPVT